METILGHDGRAFTYVIKSRKGNKGVRISVHIDGNVVVTKNPRIPMFLARAFVKNKSIWILEQLKNTEKIPKKLLSHYNAKDYKDNKDSSFVLVRDKVSHFNQFYKFEIKNITVRNQKTRWGSCSGKKNLSFNYKIIFLPEELQDYIIV
ncbi:MAG: M48 family metallopeptidase, partial [Candidatus Nomurabacteria bacterium]|nr:M48 family metallopeptidase [Candidatus Nomurabacteria bacterium]